MTAGKQFLIGQLAAAAGVKSDTVRYYEKAGLLARPERTTGGYRVYGESALAQLRFIRKAQALGFTLEEIRKILRFRGQGRETCQCVLSMAETTLAETEAKLKELHEFHDALQRNVKKWKRQTRGPLAAEFCALIEATGSTAS